MSNYTTSANVVLSVNGKQAQQMLANLEKDARRLERQIAKASTAGDKATMKKLQRELNSTNKLIEQMNGSARTTEQVLSRLGSATPKELNKALRTLQQQLNGIQRGSKAWDAHIAKIQAVKAEMAKLNASMTTQKSMWQRFNGWLNNCQTAMLGVVAAVSGLIMAGRKAVKSYAEMEEQLANTQKYTRMTREEVLELNDIFMKMDTRLAREQLNLLAQEGGRLGYNTVASVKEYVEAASIINVALVDLGEGATQTIAKLSNIFGMEQIYGVRDAMLKIGSTVNHLSQNCTAAKPFIVEFAQRMAGIGSTAKMTIPEIMAFAATLDAHGQKVEMSATALQRTIMNLYKKPAEMAKKVGLEVNSFVETLNKSTTQGVMVFLEQLNKIGEDKALAVLSPLFQDLGFEGARVSSVLTNLSSHLEFLKWQMGEASQAFRDGVSASNEYAIFNNTVQAQIDKARKKVSELAVELGEKLYPIMSHIYRSSSAFLRVLNHTVTFIINHRKAIVSLIAVIATYYGWLLLVKTATLALHAVMAIGKGLFAAYRTAILLGQIAMIAFTKGVGAAAHAMKLFNTIVKANPLGLLLSVITAVVLAFKALFDRTSEFTKKMREARNTASSFGEELSKEMKPIDRLVGKLEACTKGTKEYKEAKDELIKQYGQYLKGLIDERGEITNLTEAYNRLAAAARIAAKERSITDANKAADDAFNDKFKNLGSDLQDQLIYYGKSLKDAVRISQSVMLQIRAGGYISDELRQELEELPEGTFYDKGDHPVKIVNNMYNAYTEYNQTKEAIGEVEREHNPLKGYTAPELKRLIEYLEKQADAKAGGTIILGMNSANPTTRELKPYEVREFLDEARARLSVIESPKPDVISGNPDFTLDDYVPYETDKERRAAEMEAKRLIKKELKEQKRVRDEALAENQRLFNDNQISLSDFLIQKDKIEMEYLEASKVVLEKHNLKETDEYAAILKKMEEITNAATERMKKMELSDLKQKYTSDSAANLKRYNEDSANYDYAAYIARKEELDLKYIRDRKAVFERYNRTDLEDYANLLAEEEKLLAAQAERLREIKRREIDLEHKDKLAAIDDKFYTPGSDTFMRESEHEQEVFEELVRYLKAKRDTYLKGSSEWQRLDDQINDATRQRASAKQKEYANTYKKLMADEVRKSEYTNQLRMLTDVYRTELALAEGNEQRKLALTRAYNLARLALAKEYGVIEGNMFQQAIARSAKWLASDGGKAFTGAMSTLTQGMNEIFSGVTSLMQAELEIQTAAIEKRYDAELSRAEGNSYMEKKIEQKKQEELAKAKQEANRKMFAMQVIQAVAQTAQSAISAYSSAAAIPVVGWIMAPIAAGMALAAGAIQIAAIKKQQQASEAQGYSEGGFTPDGEKDKPVGIVHAGEWVASQKLTRNPKTRPLLEALDQAQRNNTIGSITAADVSRSIMAPMVVAAQPTAAAQPIVNVSVPSRSENSKLEETLGRLADRLDEPFGAVVTVSGEHGIARAQDEYDKLLRNKSPKSKK